MFMYNNSVYVVVFVEISNNAIYMTINIMYFNAYAKCNLLEQQRQIVYAWPKYIRGKTEDHKQSQKLKKVTVHQQRP